VYQVENTETEWCQSTPTFDSIVDALHTTVDATVCCVTELPQVQNFLFEWNDGEFAPCLHSITLDVSNVDEEILHNIKRRLKAVIEANTVGPLR
jgi:hypothetical protein